MTASLELEKLVACGLLLKVKLLLQVIGTGLNLSQNICLELFQTAINVLPKL